LDTVGAPRVEAVKLAPGNEVIYKAVVSLFPQVKLGDYKKIKIAKKPVEIKDNQIQKVLSDLQKSRGAEALVLRPAQKGDKVIIDFETYLEKIPVENGKSQKFPLVLGENTFIPGFEEQLIGLSQNQAKEFQLSFPGNYHQKNLAGKLVDFKVKVNEIFEIKLPELNDDFAKSFGDFKTLAELQDKIKDNLKHETEHKQEHELEEEIINKIIGASQFDDIPSILVDSEAKKMVEELEYNINQQGLKFDDYLTHLKKTRAELLLDFAPQALKRVKSALLMRQIALDEKINATDEELEEEVKKTIEAYGHNPEIEKNIRTAAYFDYLRNILVSQKVMDYLKSVIIK
jgi:trigger factor